MIENEKYQVFLEIETQRPLPKITFAKLVKSLVDANKWLNFLSEIFLNWIECILKETYTWEKLYAKFTKIWIKLIQNQNYINIKIRQQKCIQLDPWISETKTHGKAGALKGEFWFTLSQRKKKNMIK